MCIRKVEAWAFDGKTYEREIDAVQHAVENMIGNPGTAKAVLGRIGELLPLLNRYAELRDPKIAEVAAPSNEQKGPAADEDPPMPPEAVRELLVNSIRNKAKTEGKPEMRKLIEEAGYADLGELSNEASDMHVNALLAKVTESPVSGQVLDAQGHKADCRARATGYEADCRCGVLIRNRTTYVLPA